MPRWRKAVRCHTACDQLDESTGIRGLRDDAPDDGLGETRLGAVDPRCERTRRKHRATLAHRRRCAGGFLPTLGELRV